MSGQVALPVTLHVWGHGDNLVADDPVLGEEVEFEFHPERAVEPVGIPHGLLVVCPDDQAHGGISCVTFVSSGSDSVKSTRRGMPLPSRSAACRKSGLWSRAVSHDVDRSERGGPGPASPSPSPCTRAP